MRAPTRFALALAAGCYHPDLPVERPDGDRGADADLVTPPDGPTLTAVSADADTWVGVATPTMAHGGDALLWFGNDSSSGDAVALMHFDLSGVVGRVVSRASLRLYTVNGSSDVDFVAYRLEMRWSEPEATWQQAQAGTPWSIEGAGGSARGPAMAQFSIATDAAEVSVDLDVTGVQRWIDDPALNFGLALAFNSGGEGEAAVSSRDDAVTEHHPRLFLDLLP